LIAFLHQKKIFDFFFSDCFYEWDRKMSKYVMIHCIKYLKMHKKLEINKQIDLKNNVFFWKITNNNNMIIKVESAFSISASLEVEKI